LNDEELISAYQSAKYIVFINEKPERIKVGQTNIVIDKLLRRLSAQSAYFMTPENPFSISLCEEENMLRHRRFIEELKTGNYEYYEGYGTDEKETWPKEKSYFIICDDESKIHKLAASYGQNGFLKVSLRSPAILLVLESINYKQAT
jgi:hypothetical protein